MSDVGLSSVGSVDRPEGIRTAPEKAAGTEGLRRRLSLVVPAAAGLGLFALIWQLVALHNPDVLPRIGAIWQRAQHESRAST